MKLTPEQLKRLALLLAKAAADLTSDESVELEGLKAKATAEGIKFDTDEFRKAHGDAEASEFTEAQLESAVTKALTAALAGKNLDAAHIAAEIKKDITPGATFKMEDIEAAIKKHVEGAQLDKDALITEIKKNLPAAGVTKAELDTALAEFAKTHSRTDSKHQFPVIGGSFPVEHRSGNMTVAAKQLLNLCLMGSTEAALAKCKSVRPATINDGIRPEDLNHASRRGEAAIKSLRDSIVYGGKALTTGGAGSGAELVPTDLSSDLQMRMYLESQLAATLIASEIDMPSDPFKLPLKTTRTSFYTGSENPGSDPTKGNPGTGVITLDTAKLIGIAEYSYESDEDAIIAVLPMLQEDLAAGAAFSFENAVINGDTTATHQDSDIHAIANHHAKAFKGIRKLALAGNSKKDLSTGGITYANISAMVKQMGKYGVRPRDLLIIAGPSGYQQIVDLDETLTFDKVGSAEAARALTGSAASIRGMGIVVSDACREDLNATGVYDGTTTTKGSIFIVHKPSWVVGVKRGFTVEVDVNKMQQMNYVIASFRRDFKPKETVSASMPLALVGYNWTA